MDYFSSVQKRKVRDMCELEFYSKGHELVHEGVDNPRAYMIIKGEVDLSSSTNLYAISMQAKKN